MLNGERASRSSPALAVPSQKGKRESIQNVINANEKAKRMQENKPETGEASELQSEQETAQLKIKSLDKIIDLKVPWDLVVKEVRKKVSSHFPTTQTTFWTLKIG